FQPLLDLGQDILRDDLVPRGKAQSLEPGQRVLRCQRHDLRDRPALYTHMPGDRIEPRTPAAGARLGLLRIEPLVLAFAIEFDFQRRFQSGIDPRYPHFAESVALFAPAMRRVEREQPWIELFERLPAAGAAHLRTRNVSSPFRVDQAR